MDHGRQHARARGNGHADKVFSIRPARIGWLRVGLDVEPRQAAGPGNQENKRRHQAQLLELEMQFGKGDLV